MEELFSYFGQWTWFIIAGALLVIELALPSVFFVFLGLAAVAVGLIDLVFPMNWQGESVLFAGLSVVLLLVARPLIMKNISTTTDQPNLNQRNRSFIGKRFMLEEPIRAGRGLLNISDTNWHIRGKDMDANTWVKVVGVDGLELLVEPDKDDNSTGS